MRYFSSKTARKQEKWKSCCLSSNDALSLRQARGRVTEARNQLSRTVPRPYRGVRLKALSSPPTPVWSVDSLVSLTLVTEINSSNCSPSLAHFSLCSVATRASPACSLARSGQRLCEIFLLLVLVLPLWLSVGHWSSLPSPSPSPAVIQHRGKAIKAIEIHSLGKCARKYFN